MRTPLNAFIFILFILLIDVYIFQAVKSVSVTASSRSRSIIYNIYWFISVSVVLGFLVFSMIKPEAMSKLFRTYLFAVMIGIFLSKLTAVFFILIDDIRRGIQWLAVKIFYSTRQVDTESTEAISRSVFLNWLGLIAGGGLFGSLIYGFGNKYKYEVKNVKLSFENLPPGFKGLKILHISDIHCGSFTDAEAVMHGIDKIINQQADLILFTGDLVNNMAIEMDPYKEMFGKLKAPMGVYSTLGNHDYGDYVQWPQDGITKEQNLENLKKVHADMGWRLLMNEHVVLERGGDQIALLGIENWGAKARFPKHGRLDLAQEGTEKYPFKILMSHDPSHWDAQVLPGYPTIDLMLSGHTHGMQFGVEIPGFKWSPVQYMYKQWGGAYASEKQQLYVNRGFGFIGYPGRVGILPEITLLELG
jgi:uncharacterized protein